ncbi:MAG: DUF3422 family protein, partial [Caldimonas sp.]
MTDVRGSGVAGEAIELAAPAPDHPLRRAIADEVHARPADEVATPSRVTFIAILVDRADRENENRHLSELCRALGHEPPAPGVVHFTARSDALAIKWERHGEFSGFTLTAPG